MNRQLLNFLTIRLVINSRGRNGGHAYERGFTLVEAVIVIVITGIIGAAVAIFIKMPVRGYLDSVARAELTDTADTALRRMARDIRLALPNSVRTGVGTDNPNNIYLELLLTRTGGRYLSADDNPSPLAVHPVLDFVNTVNTSFEMVGPTPTMTQTIQAGSDSVVVYNLGPGLAPADAYAGGNRALINAVNDNASHTNPTIVMANNPFAAQSPPMPSPYNHFHVISGPVTYRYDASAQTLTRYWGYPIVAGQPLSLTALAGASSARIASGVTNCAMSYAPGNQMSTAIVDLSLTLQAAASDVGNSGSVGMFMQVHVDNTP